MPNKHASGIATLPESAPLHSGMYDETLSGRPMLQPQALQYFAEVATSGSLRQASETFYVAPSAISRQISNLEQEIGQALFERSSRGMKLTEAGEVLLQYVRESEVRIGLFRAEIEDIGQLRRGSVRIAAVEATTSTFLPSLLGKFSAEHPQIRFQVGIYGTHQVASQVAEGNADIGLAFNTAGREDLILQARIRQPLQMICRPGHALANRQSIAMADLQGARLALPDRSFGIRSIIDNAADAASISLDIVYETDSLELVKSIVRGSDIVSFMPPLTFAADHEAGSLCSVPLSDPDSTRGSLDIITPHHRKLPRSAQKFLEMLLEHCNTREH